MVAVEVDERAGRLHLEVRTAAAIAPVERRVAGRVVLLVVRALEILADVHLQRGLAVAEDVVRRADTRRDVVVAGHALGFRERDRPGIPHRRLRRAVVLGREPAPRPVVAHGALQREAATGPLILREERVVLRPVALLPRRDAHRRRVHPRHEEAEVRQNVPRVVGVVLRLLDVIRPAIADLQVVRARDVGRRRAPRVRVLGVVEDIIDAAVHPERRERRHLHEVGDGTRLLHPAPVADEGRVAGFEQELVGDRRGPGDLRDDFARVPVVGVRFGGESVAEHGPGHPVVAARPAAVGLVHAALVAVPLVVVVKADLVPRRQLRGQAHGGNRLRRRGAAEDGGIGRVVPVRGVARELVRVEPRDLRVIAEIAHVEEEPQLVALDRSANGPADVPQLDQAGGLGHALGPKGVVDVVALRPAAGAGDEEGALELVAAGHRHDVQDGTAGFGVAQVAGDRDLHFLRVGDVVGVAGHAAAVERGADVEAVELDGALVAGPAVRREEARVHRRRRAGARALQRRHGGEDRAVAARHGQLVDRLVLEHRLALGGLRVDDRRFAADVDGLSHVADFHLAVDVDHARTRDFQPFAFHARESRQRERDGVGAGPQIDYLVLPAAVGNGRACFLDQCGTRGLDRYAGEHGSRRILYDARQRGLRVRGGRQDRQPGREEDHPLQQRHTRSLVSCH